MRKSLQASKSSIWFGLGLNHQWKAWWVGLSKPIHGSAVLGSPGHLFLLNSRASLPAVLKLESQPQAGSTPGSQHGLYSFKVSLASGPFLLNNLLRDFSRKEMKGELCIGKKSRNSIWSAFKWPLGICLLETIFFWLFSELGSYLVSLNFHFSFGSLGTMPPAPASCS